MRRLITTLAILLVVVVAGMTALVMLVNPNDFRGYMVQQVAKRSGYQLQLSGNLRWHVWPRLSILSDQVTLTAPGASVPAVSAGNMRLDVELFPLLSHQLKVSQVLLKNAIIRDIPAAGSERPPGAPVAPEEDPNTAPLTRGWSFDIAQLNIADSLFIWQDAQGNQINFRNLNLSIRQDPVKQGEFELSTRVSRNQQNLLLNIQGHLDASQYPQQLSLQVSQAVYQASGVELPVGGINGQAEFSVSWQPAAQHFRLSGLKLQANNSDFRGEIAGQLLPAPSLHAQLTSVNIDFDHLLASDGNSGSHTVVRSVSAPVIADRDDLPLQDSWLRTADMDISLRSQNALWRGLQLKNLSLQATSTGGITRMTLLDGQLGEGHFSLPGQVDWRSTLPQVSLRPQLQDISLQPVLSLLRLPPALSGDLTLQGEFSGNGFTHEDILTGWQGQASIRVTHPNTGAFNLQQMVSDAVAVSSDRVKYQPEQTPVMPSLDGNFRLTPGVLRFASLKGEGNGVQIDAAGDVDFRQRSMDVTFNLLMTNWKGDSRLVHLLSGQIIPVRFYGPWDKLSYSLPITRVLNGDFRNELKSRFHQWQAQTPDKHPAHH